MVLISELMMMICGLRLDNHANVCENEKLKDSFRRCAFCSGMIEKADAKKVCSHLLQCSREWMERRSSRVPVPTTVADSMENAPIQSSAIPQLAPPASQLSRISEEDDEKDDQKPAPIATEQDEADGSDSNAEEY